jgi:hypothetical protein
MNITITVHPSWLNRRTELALVVEILRDLERPYEPMSPASLETGSSKFEAAAPTTGPELFAFAKDRDLIRFFVRFGKARSLPFRIADWSPESVAAAWDAYQSRNGPGAGVRG